MSQLISLVSNDELDNITDVIRAGVIPYTIIDNKVYWLMGVSPRGLLTDFGGGCRKEESVLVCLLRETTEEAGKNMTNVIYQSILQEEGLILWKAQCYKGPPYRYLLLTPIPFDDYQTQFVPNREVSRLTWIAQDNALNTDISKFHTSLVQYIRKFRTVNN